MAGNRFKVHDLLPPDELAAFEDFARDLRKTVDDCLTWMQAKGYTISRSAVGEWKKKFHMTDKYRAASSLAGELMSMKANVSGSVDVADAANLKLHQLLFEKLLAIEGEEEVGTKDLLGLAKALRSGAATKKDVEELKTKQRAALDVAEKDAKNGASGEAVVAKVREILGIAA